MIDNLLLLVDNTLFQHIAFLIFVFLVTWIPCINGGFVSDDHEGLSKFSDRCKDGKLSDTYEQSVGKKKKLFLNRKFNPHIRFPGCVIRWIRLNLGKKFQELGKDKNDNPIYGYIQSPRRHHVISLAIHLPNIILTYFFLSHLFGSQIAFFATLLFTVHPVSSQSVAWCSGIGYLICLCAMMLNYNLVVHVNPWIGLALTVPLTLISISGLLPGMFNFVILLLLGAYIPAAGAFLVTCICAYQNARSVVKKRVGEFKKQNMGHSTTVRPSKIFYMFKTYFYYLRLMIFPKRLGLFHTKFYHHTPLIEKADKEFWISFFAMFSLLALFIIGPFPVKFGIFWFMMYQVLFCNLVTAMQALSERYNFIPSIGYCLVVGYFLQGYPVLLAFLIGVYIMRTWVHIPTFKDEISFYRSNTVNFPDSEVALGNLGVTYMHSGKGGMAVDTWREAIEINPKYDVPHYNLFSVFRGAGDLKRAKEHIDACMKSLVVHFPEMWKKDKDNLAMQIEYTQPLKNLMEPINERYRILSTRK